MKRLKNSKGQMTVELVLLAVIFTALALLIGRFFEGNQLVASVVQSPWRLQLAGMIENGVWGEAEATRNSHPNLLSRHSSLKGDSL